MPAHRGLDEKDAGTEDTSALAAAAVDAREPGRLRLVFAITSALGIGLLPISFLPLLVGALVDDLGASASLAAAIGAAEIVAVALATIALAPRIDALPWRRLALSAAFAAALLYAASAVVRDLRWLFVLRIACGLCEGTVLAVASSVVARVREPERTYAWASVLGAVSGAGLLVAAPGVVTRGGAQGAFTALAVLALGSLPFVAWLPARGAARAGDDARRAVSLGALLGRSGGALLAAALAASTGQSAVWAFSERIGVAAGLTPDAIGGVFGAATLAGIAGSALAGWLGTRRGRGGPIAFGYATFAAAILLIAVLVGVRAFVVGQFVFALAFFFLTPYLVGVAAALDAGGRIAAAMSGAMLLGAGLGPALAGAFVAGDSFAPLGWAAIALTLASLALLAPVLQRIRREALRPL